MAIREGKWRCPYCATINLGRDVACAACGATRDEEVSFFLEDATPGLTDRTLLSQAHAGADWLCAFCRTSNRSPQARCANCGAERGQARARPVRERRATPPPAPRAAFWPRGWLLGAGLLAALLAALLGFLALRTSEESVTVAGFQWARSIEVEAYRTLRESAWEGELPAGARVLARSRELHHTERVRTGSERVKVGTRDLGNGFFEDVYEERPLYEERAVYRERLSYEVERWVVDRVERVQGADQIPRWPAWRRARGEREGRRSETYIVLLRGRRTYLMELPKERWSSLRVDETRTALIRGRRAVELR